jgi:RTX calcium-binding nonapeptide repeat (4 copies)
MAIVKAYMPVDMLAADVWYGEVTRLTQSRITIDAGPLDVTYRGSFYTPDGYSIDGRLDSVTQSHYGRTAFEVTGINADAGRVYQEVQVEGDAWGAFNFIFKGNDHFAGSNRGDTLVAFAGNDLVNGRGGDDFLFGAQGNDRLSGGGGDDCLFGGAGSDALTGGSGADTFWFDARQGVDRVTDFSRADWLVIDTSTGLSDFRGTDQRDVAIWHGARFDKVYVEGDLVAEVHGAHVTMSDFLFV